MVKKKFYNFLDLAIDVFYGIILFNTFLAFPGININGAFMIFSVFVMINYWWSNRNYPELPKHYLFDFYMITIIMFIFTQWTNYYFNIKGFLSILYLFYFIDGIYSLIAIPLHIEKRDEPSLKFFTKIDFILGGIYLAYSFLLDSMNIFSLLIIVIPYLIILLIELKKGYFKTRFEKQDETY